MEYGLLREKELFFNIKKIDDAYLALFALLDKMNAFFKEKNMGKKFEISTVISGLINYTDEVFCCEEKLMLELDYPEQEYHKEEHDYCRLKVLSFVESFKNGQEDLMRLIIAFVRSWAASHLSRSDRKFCEYYKQKNLK